MGFSLQSLGKKLWEVAVDQPARAITGVVNQANRVANQAPRVVQQAVQQAPRVIQQQVRPMVRPINQVGQFGYGIGQGIDMQRRRLIGQGLTPVQQNFIKDPQINATFNKYNPSDPTAFIPQGVKNAYDRTALRTVVDNTRDIFDANTQSDINKRLAQGQPADYRTQQIQMGNKRPYQNLGATLIGQSARYANTLGAAGKELNDTIQIGALQAIGANDLANKVMDNNMKWKQEMYKPNSGILGQGTIFDNPEQYGKLSTADLAGRVGAVTAGTALEVIPYTKGAGLAGSAFYKGLSPAKQVATRTLAGAGENVIQDLTEQKFMYDKWNPAQSAMAAGFGAVMPNIGPMAQGANALLRQRAGTNALNVLGNLNRQINLQKVAENASKVPIPSHIPAPKIIPQNAPTPRAIYETAPKPSKRIAQDFHPADMPELPKGYKYADANGDHVITPQGKKIQTNDMQFETEAPALKQAELATREGTMTGAQAEELTKQISKPRASLAPIPGKPVYVKTYVEMAKLREQGINARIQHTTPGVTGKGIPDNAPKPDPLEALKAELETLKPKVRYGNGRQSDIARYKQLREEIKNFGKKPVRTTEQKPDYGMSHRPSNGAPSTNLSKLAGEDIYNNPHYFGDMNDPATGESIDVIKKIRNNPDAEVTIYRASPKNELNNGDWVTFSKKYAQQEAKTEGVPVNSFKVKAKEVGWAGDSLNEFGYFPKSKPLYETAPKVQLKKTVAQMQKQLETEPLIGGREVVHKVGNAKKGIEKFNLESRPVLRYGGYNKGVFTDSYMAVMDKQGAKKIYDELIHDEALRGAKILKKAGKPVDMAKVEAKAKRIFAEEAKHNESNYPDLSKIISDAPTTKAGIKGYYARPNQVVEAVLSDGKIHVNVKADILAKMEKVLPGAEYRITGELGDPVQVVKNGKVKGLIMPLRSSYDDIPEKIKVSKPIYETVPSGTFKEKPKVVQKQKAFTQDLIDQQAQKFRKGEIDEKQLRAFLTDNYEQTFKKKPTSADIQGYIDGIKGQPSPKIETIRKQVKAEVEPQKPKVKIKDQGLDTPVSPEMRKNMIEYEKQKRATISEWNKQDTISNAPGVSGKQLDVEAQRMLDRGARKDEVLNLYMTEGKLNKGQAEKSVARLKDFNNVGLDSTPTKEAPHTIEGIFEKYLGVKNLSEKELTTSKRVGLRAERDKLKKLNPLRMAEGIFGEAMIKSNKSKVGHGLARAGQYVNKEIGQDKAIIEAAHKLQGNTTYTEGLLTQLGQDAYRLLPDEASRIKVHAFLDPGAGIKPGKLNANEQQAAKMLKDMGDAINDTSYRAGKISKETWQKNKGGKYIARMYTEIKNSKDATELLGLENTKGLFEGMYKSRKVMNDELREKMLRDPVKLAVIRMRQVQANADLTEYMRKATRLGYVKDTNPGGGWVKVPRESRMDEWSGKWVKQDVYENVNGFRSTYDLVNTANHLLDLYDGNPARRVRKKLLTIFNPIVRAGNVTSNYIFAGLNGVNPVTFQKNKLWAHKAIKNNDPLMLQAQKAGLINNDIVLTDKNLVNKDKKFVSEIEKSTRSTAQDLLHAPKDASEWLTKKYGQTDDIAKLSALKSHVDRGYSIKEAIEMTRRGFQDYSRVGHLYDMGAKSPIFGNAFIRFQGDLFTNILKNAAIDHPARLAAIPLGILALGTGMSKLSGESDEDRATRENRVGAPKIPFTNISTEVMTPYGAVDASRFMGIYARNDIDGNSFTDNLSRFSPFNVTNPFALGTEEGRRDAIKKAASDPLIGPMISTLFDVDWVGKSVADPSGVTNTGKQLYPDQPLSEAQKWTNRLQYLTRSYAAYPMNELGDLAASFRGDAKNEQNATMVDNEGKSVLAREGYNTSGSKKTVGQALARLVGVRAQQYGPEEAQQERDKQEMFKQFASVDKWKESLDSKTRAWFESAHASVRNRDGSQTEFSDDPLYTVKRAGDLLDDKKFDVERQYAYMQNKNDGKPIDPVFDLPREYRLKVLQKKQLPPGAKDPELSNLYSKEWYQDYQVAQDRYYKDKQAYNQKKGYKQLAESNPYPNADAKTQKIIDYYNSLPKGTGARSSWIRNNPQAYQMMQNQWAAKDNWENKERIARGLAPTEGAEGIASGYGQPQKSYGYSRGGYSGGGGSKTYVQNPYKYAVSLKSGRVANPKVRARIASVGGRTTTTKKPQVKLKKSLV